MCLDLEEVGLRQTAAGIADLQVAMQPMTIQNKVSPLLLLSSSSSPFFPLQLFSCSIGWSQRLCPVGLIALLLLPQVVRVRRSWS